jgi:hypothetical protein
MTMASPPDDSGFRNPGPTVYKFIRRHGEYIPVVINNDGKEQEVVWAPMPGSQDIFLRCMDIEVLLEGNRGGGKSDTMLMDFYQDVGKGYGPAWSGVMIRQTHPMLLDLIEKSKRLYKRLCPEAFYNEIKYTWTFPGGERLRFAHFNIASDFDNFLGHSYAWIGWDELSRWATPIFYMQMFSCLRSVIPGMPRKVRSTTNPYGVGHNWIQTRFNLINWPREGVVLGERIVGEKNEKTGLKDPPRRAIHSDLAENKLLMHTDPDYLARVSASARNESERQAWVHGSWDITAGGMFDDIWPEVREVCVMKEFDIPIQWPIFRAYDHGSGKPFSVQYYAVSDGTDLTLRDGKVRATVRGDYFLVGEVYGWTGQENEGLRLPVTEIAKRIIEYEIKRKWRDAVTGKSRIKRGPADTGIFDDVNGICLATDFEKPVLIHGKTFPGVVWEKADKGPGSREQGWEQIRKRLMATKRPADGYRETPGLFIMLVDGERINHWIRTVPSLRRDEKKIDDIDDEAEDHSGDACRYALRYEGYWFTATSRRI